MTMDGIHSFYFIWYSTVTTSLINGNKFSVKGCNFFTFSIRLYGVGGGEFISGKPVGNLPTHLGSTGFMRVRE